jgi:peptidoglycan hydrolase CwlO-like protein
MGAFGLGLSPFAETMLALVIFGIVALAITYVNRRYGLVVANEGDTPRKSDSGIEAETASVEDEIQEEINRLERKVNPGTATGGGVMPDDLISALQAAQSEIDRLEERVEELEDREGGP